MALPSLTWFKDKDFTQLHQLTINPLEILNLQRYRWQGVVLAGFCPSFLSQAGELRGTGSALQAMENSIIGSLIFGNSKRRRANRYFKFIVYGYVFCYPHHSGEPLLFRVCRTARKLNRDSQQSRLLESIITMSMRPTRVFTSNKEFALSHTQTA